MRVQFDILPDDDDRSRGKQLYLHGTKNFQGSLRNHYHGTIYRRTDGFTAKRTKFKKIVCRIKHKI